MQSVLVVEDDELLVKVLERLLTVGGFAVRAAGNGEEALEMAEIERPDLIILDGMLPGMHGFEILRSLREAPGLGEIPVIFLTAQDREEDIVRGLSLGASDYIVKPFKPKELMVRVTRALGQAQAAQ
ncbi:MAG: response regulator [Rhodospirillales bacterium]|nr:response regulator [Rhodospirillales bacterium]